MLPDIGNIALFLALLLTLVQSASCFAGAQLESRSLMKVGVLAAKAQFVFYGVAFSTLIALFLLDDFSVLYVFANSNTALPREYKIAATWGGHEGSILLWATILSVWTLAVAFFSRSLSEVFRVRVLGTMGLISIGFLLFILSTSNPFDRLIPAPTNGRDLNPLLQDQGMIFHPPVLYMGYVGFSVAFSFAIAALLGGELNRSWAKWTKWWTLLAWCFLTLGIAFGSKWAYYELGWGDWWFWDAVENASFMPWLAGTALIHSLSVSEKRDTFKVWTVFLAILAFALCIIGTFLVRSGIITSVHAFAADPARGLFILILLSCIVGGSLVLFAFRSQSIQPSEGFSLISRESFLLVNNVVLMSVTGSVMLGTLYPLFLDALGLGKISVGPPYFDAVFVPLMSPAILLMGFATFSRWGKDGLSSLFKKLRGCLGISLLAAVSLPLMMGAWKPMVALGLFMAFWILFTSAYHLFLRLKQSTDPSWLSLFRLPKAYQGMLIAHVGVAIFIIGVTLIKGYEVSRDLVMMTGDTTRIDAYTFTFDKGETVKGPNYVAFRGHFVVTEDGSKDAFSMEPEKRFYFVQKTQMTEASISPGFFKDLYLSMPEQIDDKHWAVRIYIKPFANWIWTGCFLMAIGGLFSMSDKRYRRQSCD